MSKYVPPHKKAMESNMSDTSRFPQSGHSNRINYVKDDYQRPYKFESYNDSYKNSYKSSYKDYRKDMHGKDMNGKDMHTVNVFDKQDFPSLSKPVTNQNTQKTNRPTFAQLATEWSKKMKEKKEKEDAEAEEKEANEKKPKEKNSVAILSNSLHSLKMKEEEPVCDIGCHVSSDSDYEYNSNDEEEEDVEEDEEEEEDEDVCWDYRRNKNELSML